VPVVIGPHYENFRGIVDKLRAVEAIAVVEPSTLPQAIHDMLTDQNAAGAMGARARAVFESEAGATERAVMALMAVLEERA
jgi:3-deoxy-D-manno-octulosonic-acid transferase